MDEKKVLKKSNQIVTRKIESEVILLPLYKSSKDPNCIYTLNETVAVAWELINGKRTLGEIKERLMDKFEVGEEKLTKQLDRLITDFKSIRAIV